MKNNKFHIVGTVLNFNRKKYQNRYPRHTTTRPFTFLAWYRRYRKKQNIIKFGELMSTKYKIKLTELCKFIQVINKAVCAPG